MSITNRFLLLIVDIFIGVLLTSAVLYFVFGIMHSEEANGEGPFQKFLQPSINDLTLYLFFTTLYWTCIDYVQKLKAIRETRIISTIKNKDASLYLIALRSLLKSISILIWPVSLLYVLLNNKNIIFYDQALKTKRLPK